MLKPVKILTKNYETPDSHTLAVYQANGGYEAAKKALGMTPRSVERRCTSSGRSGERRSTASTRAMTSRGPKGFTT